MNARDSSSRRNLHILSELFYEFWGILLFAVSNRLAFLQDRIFDVIDLNAEIEKAKSTLEAADIVFQRHATKFNNQDDDEQTMSIAQKLDRTRKIANIEMEKPKSKTYLIKWPKMPVDEPEAAQPIVPVGRQRRINSLIDTSEISDPLESLAMQPMKRRFLKRKKSVSF